MAFDAPEAKKGLEIGRRQFMTWSAGGAYVLAMTLPTDADPSPQVAAAPAGEKKSASPWFKINADGRMTVLSTAVEMGQGSHTGHATIIADELDMPWDRVDVQMVDLMTYNNQVSTGGSGASIRPPARCPKGPWSAQPARSSPMSTWSATPPPPPSRLTPRPSWSHRAS
jgi:hypothetical protein